MSDKVSNINTNLSDKVSNTTNLTEKVADTTTNIKDKVVDGTKSAFNTVKDTTTNLKDKVVDKVTDSKLVDQNGNLIGSYVIDKEATNADKVLVPVTDDLLKSNVRFETNRSIVNDKNFVIGDPDTPDAPFSNENNYSSRFSNVQNFTKVIDNDDDFFRE
jgi:hypothetical protein